MTGRVLTAEQWLARQMAHEQRVDAATAGHRARRARGRAHPVEDFLFEYYRYSPAQLRRWHPGPGIVLSGGARSARAGWRHYRVGGDDVEFDLASFVAVRHATIRFVGDLLTATLARAPFLGCSGLHEWAMLYRAGPGDVRHPGLPLRLGSAGTDNVVESHVIRCTHADAYRFFTTDARPRNTLSPSRATQVALEQPGCLHAGMDLYKWAYTLAPLVPSGLTADAFDLAREIRVLDMQASPYDLADLGYEPVRIETATGRAEYRERQRAFTERSSALRRRLLTVLDQATPMMDQAGPPPARRRRAAATRTADAALDEMPQRGATPARTRP
ncbi:MAG: 3-methyladenine DNA glycosylase [Dermatophilaceae bacterium]